MKPIDSEALQNATGRSYIQNMSNEDRPRPKWTPKAIKTKKGARSVRYSRDGDAWEIEWQWSLHVYHVKFYGNLIEALNQARCIMECCN